MDQTTAALRQDIDATREAMTDKLELIESRVKGQVDDTVHAVKDAFDIQLQVQQRPWVALGAAVVVGAVLGSVDAPSPRAAMSSWQPDYRWPPQPDYGPSERSQKAQMVMSQASGVIHDVRDQFMDYFGDELDTVKAAAVATLTTMARDWLKEALPDFGAQFERVLTEQQSRRKTTAYRAPAGDGASLNPTPAPATTPAATNNGPTYTS